MGSGRRKHKGTSRMKRRFMVRVTGWLWKKFGKAEKWGRMSSVDPEVPINEAEMLSS